MGTRRCVWTRITASCVTVPHTGPGSSVHKVIYILLLLLLLLLLFLLLRIHLQNKGDHFKRIKAGLQG